MTATRRPPALADTLAVLLPDAAETALLRVCLGIDRGATAAAWAAGIGAPGAPGSIFAERPALRRLYPMLHATLGSEAGSANPQLAAVLRAGVLWEEQRAARVREILASVLSALRQVGVKPVLLKGVALAETVYPRPGTRHCHDIDLLVSVVDQGKAAAGLKAAGFNLDGIQPGDTGTVVLLHRDGLPVQLHTRLLPTRGWLLAQDALIARAGTIEIAGESVAMLGATDMLLQVCGLAADGAGGSPSWVVDAALILRKHRLTPDKWDALAKTAVAGGLALPVLAMFTYLAGVIEIDIPESLFDALEARRPPSAEKDAVLRELRRRPGRLTGMIAQSGWRSRVAIARWLVLPSPTHLKTWCAERGLRWTPAWYIARPFRRLGIVAGILRMPAGSPAP
ncbi:MAG: nucleotidyltransferase family protein [Bauldia sp.]